MHQANMTVDIRQPVEGVSVLDIRGEITAFAEDKLLDTFSRASTTGTRVVILNMSGLDYMNSSGIGLLVMLLVRANRQQQRVMAVGLSEHYRNIFELTRLNEAIQIFETEEAALAQLT